MAINLDKDLTKRLNTFYDKVEAKAGEKLTIEQECMIKQTEALMILADKIGRKLP